ncbi:unnamed protein product [Polarella glacialis]|nr:unnamed protein product [Polarella glacialis]
MAAKRRPCVTWFDERLGESPTWSQHTKNTFIDFDGQEEEWRAALRRERSAPACILARDWQRHRSTSRRQTAPTEALVASLEQNVEPSTSPLGGPRRWASSRASSRASSCASGASGRARLSSSRGRRSSRSARGRSIGCSSRSSGRSSKGCSSGRSSGRSSCRSLRRRPVRQHGRSSRRCPRAIREKLELKPELELKQAQAVPDKEALPGEVSTAAENPEQGKEHTLQNAAKKFEQVQAQQEQDTKQESEEEGRSGTLLKISSSLESIRALAGASQSRIMVKNRFLTLLGEEEDPDQQSPAGATEVSPKSACCSRGGSLSLEAEVVLFPRKKNKRRTSCGAEVPKKISVSKVLPNKTSAVTAGHPKQDSASTVPNKAGTPTMADSGGIVRSQTMHGLTGTSAKEADRGTSPTSRMFEMHKLQSKEVGFTRPEESSANILGASLVDCMEAKLVGTTVPKLGGAQAFCLASLAVKGNELAVAKHLREGPSRRLVLASPANPCLPHTMKEILPVELGMVVHAEAVDSSGWGFGSIVAPASMAGRSGCFRCVDFQVLAVELLRQNSLDIMPGDWKEVARMQASSTQSRLRQKAILNRIRVARSAWQLQEP